MFQVDFMCLSFEISFFYMMKIPEDKLFELKCSPKTEKLLQMPCLLERNGEWKTERKLQNIFNFATEWVKYLVVSHS